MQALVSIVHLDDDALFLKAVASELSKSKQPIFDVRSFQTTEYFWKSFSEFDPQIALIDLHLGAQTAEGLQVIERLAKQKKRPLILCLSNDLELVGEAMMRGADDFILKTASMVEITLRVTNLVANHHKDRDDLKLKRQPIGKAHHEILQRAPNIVKSAVRSVHVFGETGTGKELVADIFEAASEGPFVRVNCGALSPTLLESELFGHVRGAFTGALSDRIGLLEAANGGWLFLDEVHLLTQNAQAALLRAIENHEITRVGDSKPRKIDCRVLSAANQNVSDLTKNGSFKKDLWQRLSEVSFMLPPLKYRVGELSELIDHFCKMERGGPYKMLPETRSVLSRYDWSEGNVRELRSCIRAMTEKHANGELTPATIPSWLWQKAAKQPGSGSSSQLMLDYPRSATFQEMSDKLFLHMVSVMRQDHPGISLRELGEKLGFPKSTLIARLNKANLPVSE